jgi:hypothetical protein
MVRAILDGRKTQTRRVVKPPKGCRDARYAGVDFGCPYGQPGDRLRVRETWQHEDMCCDDHRCGQPSHIYYKATEVAPETFASWRLPQHMPKWACRLWLEITDVRVQRLQEITYDDALVDSCTDVTFFRVEWNTYYAKRGYSWADNPWVWALTFKVVKP